MLTVLYSLDLLRHYVKYAAQHGGGPEGHFEIKIQYSISIIHSIDRKDHYKS